MTASCNYHVVRCYFLSLTLSSLSLKCPYIVLQFGLKRNLAEPKSVILGRTILASSSALSNPSYILFDDKGFLLSNE